MSRLPETGACAADRLAELEARWSELLGKRDMERLRGLLQRLNEAPAPHC